MDLLLLFFLFFSSSTSSSSLLLLIVVAVVIVMLIDFDICVSNSAFKCSLCGWGDLHEIGNCYVQLIVWVWEILVRSTTSATHSLQECTSVIR